MKPFYENKFDSLYASASHSLTFPSHLHNLIECIYVVEGEIEVRIEQQTALLKAGELAIIFPNVVHSYYSDYKHMNYCEFFFYPVKSTSKLYTLIQGKRLQTPFLTQEIISPDVPGYLHELVSLFRSENPDFLLAETLTELTLLRILNCIELTKLDETTYNSLIEKTVVYLTQNFKEPVTLEGTAKTLGVSKYHLSHTLNTSLGMNFSTYINHLKIDYAKSQLLTSGLSISEIAFDSGFESLRTFNRSFKQIAGCSPKEFRQMSVK